MLYVDTNTCKSHVNLYISQVDINQVSCSGSQKKPSQLQNLHYTYLQTLEVCPLHPSFLSLCLSLSVFLSLSLSLSLSLLHMGSKDCKFLHHKFLRAKVESHRPTARKAVLLIYKLTSYQVVSDNYQKFQCYIHVNCTSVVDPEI